MKQLAVILFTLFPVFILGQSPDNIRRSGVNTSHAKANINLAIDKVNNHGDTVTQHRGEINYNKTSLDSLNNGTGILVVDSISTGGFILTNTYHDDLRVPLTNTRVNPSKSEPVFEDMGGGAFAFGFDADADSSEALHFIAQLPHGWKTGTDLDAHIHWAPGTTNTGSVVWKLAYQMAAIGDTLTDIAYIWVTDAADGVALKHQIVDFGDIPGDSLGLSAMIVGWVSRVGDDAADTFTGSAYGLEIDFHYEIDGFGSSEEYVK